MVVVFPPCDHAPGDEDYETEGGDGGEKPNYPHCNHSMANVVW